MTSIFLKTFIWIVKKEILLGTKLMSSELIEKERKKVFLVVTLSERNRLKDKKLFFFFLNKFPSTSNNHISRKIFLLSTDVEKMSFSSFFY